MAIKDRIPEEFKNDQTYLRLLRKANQAWDMAGGARMDNDSESEKKYTAEAQDWDRQRREYMGL